MGTTVVSKLLRILESHTLQSDMMDGFTHKFSDDGRIFEDNFSQLLVKSGYIEIKSDELVNKKELKKYILNSQSVLLDKKYIDVANNTFIAEPFGSQSSPDFLIISNGKLLCVELKVTKHGSPKWNNTLPHQHAIYLFLANNDPTRIPELIIFKGSDVITARCENKIKHFGKLLQRSANFVNKFDKFHRGWNIYFRINFVQSLGDSKSIQLDYTKHTDKESNKLSALEFIRVNNI